MVILMLTGFSFCSYVSGKPVSSADVFLRFGYSSDSEVVLIKKTLTHYKVVTAMPYAYNYWVIKKDTVQLAELHEAVVYYRWMMEK